MSNYIFTHSKTKFNPLKPIAADIRIKDIAHSLSLLARANGHFNHFYSVAQHSVNCYVEAKKLGFSTRVQLGCLLHDASESYIADLTRPVKLHLQGYSEIEETLQNAIYEKFGLGDLSDAEKLQIKHVDDVLLYHEFIALMGMLSPSKKPINEAKNTAEGKDIRINILRQHYDQTTDFIEHVRNHPELRKKEVDCIDALCLAVTGMLGLETGFNFIPETPSRDRRGLLMQMVYANKT